MKTTIFSIALLTSFAFASAEDNVLAVSSVTRENNQTKVSLSRDISRFNVYTGQTQAYQLGAFTKTFTGNLSDKEIAEKVSRIVDNFITVKSGAYTAVGKNQELASSRSKAFFRGGYDGYFAELASQLAEEK